jgi:hydroxyacylglutathione hydrolase
MTLQISAIPAFEDNYIWMLQRSDTLDTLVVDPGDAAVVLESLHSSGARLTDILITHHHPDHTGGIEALRAHVPEVRVHGPRNDRIKGLTHYVQDHQRLRLLGIEFQVLEVPGHTLDHVAYVSNDFNISAQPFVFCGDTLFSAGCGRLREGTPAQLLNSLHKLASLPPETLVYCTHEYTLSNLRFALHLEPDNIACQRRMAECLSVRQQGLPTLPSSIAMELRTNPFLRCRTDELSAIVRTQFGPDHVSELDVFTQLRRWKDGFTG